MERTTILAAFSMMMVLMLVNYRSSSAEGDVVATDDNEYSIYYAKAVVTYDEVKNTLNFRYALDSLVPMTFVGTGISASVSPQDWAPATFSAKLHARNPIPSTIGRPIPFTFHTDQSPIARASGTYLLTVASDDGNLRFTATSPIRRDLLSGSGVGWWVPPAN